MPGRAAPAGHEGVIYLTVTDGGAPDTLAGVTTPVAAEAAVHQSIDADARRPAVGHRQRLQPTLPFTGDGTVDVHVKTPAQTSSRSASAVGTGAGPVSATLVGDDLSSVFDDGPLAISSTSPQGVPILHDVTITEGATAVSGAIFIFAACQW